MNYTPEQQKKINIAELTIFNILQRLELDTGLKIDDIDVEIVPYVDVEYRHIRNVKITMM